MKDIRKKFNIQIDSPYWDTACDAALADPSVPEWLTEDYLRKLHAECGILPKTLETLVSAAKHVAAVPELCLLAKILFHILGTKEKFSSAFSQFELPLPPETTVHAIGYDCVAIFPVVAHLRPTWNAYKARGIEDAVLTDSLRWADNIFYDAIQSAGKPAFPASSFKVYGVAIYTNHLTVGRLRFEIHENSARPVKIFKNRQGEFCPLFADTILHASGHILGSVGAEDEAQAYAADFTETDEYYEGYTLDTHTRLALQKRIQLPKKDWQQVYASGATALKVHIPYGGKMTAEMCAESFSRARELFNRCFPEYKFTCFLICCWMLCPQLKDILPESSNIIAFQNNFLVYPMKNAATDALLYVFGIEGKPVTEIDFDTLPENNSLQRGIKQKLQNGQYIHQFGGYIPW